MFNALLSKLTIAHFAKALLIPFVFVAGLAGYQLTPNDLTLGNAVLPIAGTTYNLSGSGISSSATSMTLVSFTLPQTGHAITDSEMSTTFYLTVEPGSRTRQEIVSCTTVVQNANGTATLSGCSRGLLPITPYTASSTYAFPHGGGTSVVFSNAPQFYNQFLAADNTGTITGQYTFSTSPIVPTVISASTTNAASVAYVNNIAILGGASSSDTVYGFSKLSVAPANANLPIAVGDNDTRLPTTAQVGYIPSSGQKDALAGSSGTPSATNKYLTQTSLATTTTSGGIVQASSTGKIDTSFVQGKFGGTGVDGALTLTSGTTTINLGGLTVVEKNYSSISITGTGALAFTNASSSGTIIILKSQGNVTLTSSAVPNIDVSGMGAASGTAATNGTQAWGIVFNASTTAFVVNNSAGLGNNLTDGTISIGGNGYVNQQYYTYNSLTLFKKSINITPGSAGGGGKGRAATAVGGSGGSGGGGLIIECNGAWNFTATNGISVAGKNGSVGVTGDQDVGAGGGGGGAGGFLIALYNSLTANSGTVNISGGNGGNGSNGTGGTGTSGGGGGSGAGMLGGRGGNGTGGATSGGSAGNGASGSNSLSTGAGAGTGGTGGANSGGGAGGGGTAGEYIIAQNNFLF